MTARVIYDMPEHEYHAHPAFSQSGAKVLLKSPARFKWERDNPVHRDVFDEGSAAHRLVLGVGADIYVVPAESWRTNDSKMQQAEARRNGLVPVLPETYERVAAMADKLSEHSLAMQLLSAGDPEVSLFHTDPATGVKIRGRFDFLGAVIASDYKTTAKEDPQAFGRSVADFGYHMQAAWYLDLLEAVGLPRQAFAFIVQSKTPPYDVFVSDLTDAAIQRGRELNRRAIERFRDCTASGLWPSPVRDDAWITTDLPRWAYYDNEIEEQTA